ncbi:hypothetical protein BN938_1052 [Mucinivorans hirudinis]|uniref:SbsA Ig-like domain-containing protein n=1 Tax=Mucinivorans hirudinis TaxID=1433126 RepID=A0A060RCK0_9BACT|nr:hypothetical protein BN938_1052 [Mucinivorans hirudinis]
MKSIIRYTILASLVMIFAWGCANISAPKGGPRDSLPPVVIRTTPAQFTTNFNGKKVVIEFDEYVQLKDQSKFFFVSPPMEKRPKLNIRGKTIEVQFEQMPDSATTYRLDFGSSIVDNNEGNKLNGFTYTFSTGDVIDSLVMVGQTIGAYERDSVINAIIFYYDPSQDKQQKDSTVFNGKVSAMFRTDSSGYFVADILRDKPYLIYALDDTNGDQKYQPGVDRIAFTEKRFNPTELEEFTLTMDSVRKHMVIDPVQVTLELFKETPIRRQTILKQERPHRQKIVLSFNSSDVLIDSLELKGIDPDWIIRENGTVGDTVTLWIAPTTIEDIKQLKDTIAGTMLLRRQDSVWNNYMSKEKLSFTHKIVLSEEELKEIKAKEREAKREQKRQPRQRQEDTLPVADSLITPVTIEADSAKSKAKNPFNFKVDAANPLIPSNNIVFTFDFPLRSADTARIELYHSTEVKAATAQSSTAASQKQEVKVPFILTKSPTNIRQWTLRADWKANQDYRLIIPSGTFTDITHLSNDTLKSQFRIADPDKYGTLIFKTIKDTSDKNSYIFELLERQKNSYKIVMRKVGVRSGDVLKFDYVKPGDYYLRIVEDSNHNGKWDTGSLVDRRQPERVRIVRDGGGDKKFIAKERWEVEEIVNLKNIFEK